MHGFAVCFLGSWVVILPYSLSSVLCSLLCVEKLVSVGRLLGTVCVNSCVTFFKEKFGKVFPVDVESTNKAALLICTLDVDLNVSLQTTPICKIMCFLAEWLGLFVWIASGAWSSDA